MLALAHFGVYHPDKPPIMCCIMDAKAKNNLTSLNDLLFTAGSDLLNSLFSMLLNFKMGAKHVADGLIMEMFSFSDYDGDTDK